MGRRNKKYQKPLREQFRERLTSMQAFGESKRQAVMNSTDKGKIFSFATYKSYWKVSKRYLRWLKKNHPDISTMKAARRHVREYLEEREQQTDSSGKRLSAWTLHLEASALHKLFGIDKNDPSRYVPPPRYRVDITRSRTRVARDRHFSEANNNELIRFARGTGLRRGALQRLKGRDLWTCEDMERKVKKLSGKPDLSSEEHKLLVNLNEALELFPNNGYFVCHQRDKGGKSDFFSPIIGPDTESIVQRMRNTAPDKKVWEHVNTNADIHAYRADYATTLYKSVARRIEDIPYDKINHGTGLRYQSDVYHCRGDERGRKLDRRAMLIVSKALLHNRLDVISSHYLRGI
jgi:uncharacterized short protein YbdD (DUF466 family)